MTRPLIAYGLLALAACGGGAPPPTQPTTPPPAADSRTPIERRRDAACDKLAPILLQCAMADAKADLAAGKTTQQEYTQDTSPAFQRKHQQDWDDTCKVQLSTRQVRVLEVCREQETECDAIAACLEHLNDKVAPK